MTTPDQAFNGWVLYGSGSGGGGGNAFVQGGNAFGATAVLGTTDSQPLRLTAPTVNIAATTAFQVNGSAGLAGQVLTSQGPGSPAIWSAAGGGGPWTLVETKTLVAAASSTFAGLDGDTDKIYWLEGELTCSAGSQAAIYPNANSGLVCRGSCFYVGSGSPPVPGSLQLDQILIPGSTTFAGTSRVTFWMRIDANTRGGIYQPTFQTQAIFRRQDISDTTQEQTSNAYAASPIVNLTSLQVAAVAGTLTGQVSLYKLSRT